MWKHTIVKTAKTALPRLSVTYRASSSRYSPVTKQITMGLPYPPQVFNARPSPLRRSIMKGRH